MTHCSKHKYKASSTLYRVEGQWLKFPFNANIVHHSVFTLFSLTVIPEIIFPNDSFAGYVVNVTDPVTFECIATGIPPPTIQWFRDGVLLSSGVMLSEPSQTMVSAPMGTGMIYQVERTLVFTTAANDTGTYTCEASNINEVQPTATQNYTIFVQSESGIQ